MVNFNDKQPKEREKGYMPKWECGNCQRRVQQLYGGIDGDKWRGGYCWSCEKARRDKEKMG